MAIGHLRFGFIYFMMFDANLAIKNLSCLPSIFVHHTAGLYIAQKSSLICLNKTAHNQKHDICVTGELTVKNLTK